MKVRHLTRTRTRTFIDFDLTKNGNRVRIPLVDTVAADLWEYLALTRRDQNPDGKTLDVSDRNNLMRLHKAQLKLAGIPYQDAKHGYADFHGLRKSVNTHLRRKGVPLAHRQRFLRHAAADLATKHYDEASDPKPTINKRVMKLLAELDTILTANEPDVSKYWPKSDATRTAPPTS